MVGRWKLPLVVGATGIAGLLLMFSDLSALSGTRVFEAQGEVANLSEWDFVHNSGTNNLFEDTTTAVFSGHYGFVAFVPTANGNARGCQRILTTAPNRLHFHERFTVGTLNGSSVDAFYHITTLRKHGPPTTQVTVQLNVKDIGTTYPLLLSIGDDRGNLAGITRIPVDTLSAAWHTLDVYVSKGATDGEVAMTVDGFQVFYADTFQIDTTMVDSMMVGYRGTVGSTTTGYLAWDDVIVDTMCGPPCGYSLAGSGSGESKILQMEEIHP